MDYQIKWTSPAYRDLVDIIEFVIRDSPKYASSLTERILESVRSLNQFPFRSRIVPEFNRKDIRELFVMNYRIIFNIKDEEIIILAVIHFARELTGNVPDH